MTTSLRTVVEDCKIFCSKSKRQLQLLQSCLGAKPTERLKLSQPENRGSGRKGRDVSDSLIIPFGYRSVGAFELTWPRSLDLKTRGARAQNWARPKLIRRPGNMTIGPSTGIREAPLTSVQIELPIAVDLDGTLVASDSLHEGWISAFRADPLRAILLLKSIRDGKAAFKKRVCEASATDPAGLPYNEAVVAYLRSERKKGRRIGLFTAADTAIAEAVAAHLGIFDVVRGSDGVVNLSGSNKLRAIIEEFGPDFTYIGDNAVDRPIFGAASSVGLVGNIDKLKRLLPASSKIELQVPSPRLHLGTWLKAMRVEHWAKNTLVFVAPILAFQLGSLQVALQGLLLFVLLGLMASGTYIINDLFDLAADRRHAWKRLRPFASGKLLARDGAVVAALLIGGALLVSLFLPLGCTFCLLIYLLTTLAYSISLKKQPIVDVITLAGLFTLRIVAGSFLVPQFISPWLLTFSMFFFLGLALVKRYAELERVVRLGGYKLESRGYTGKDLPLLLSAGVAGGFSAIVIFMIYLINEQYPHGIYSKPEALWGTMPIILLWTLRVWHLALNGRMTEDPVVFAGAVRNAVGIQWRVLR